MHWSTVSKKFGELKDSDKTKLLKAIKQPIFDGADPEPSRPISDIRETGFNKGVIRVRYGCQKLRRNGRYKDRHRYICTRA